MRVLIFSIAYEPFVGGAEVAVKEITARLPDFQFDMVTLNLDGKQKSHERIGNVDVYRINSSKNLFPIKAYLFAKKLHKGKGYKLVWSIMANWAGFAGLFFKWRFPQTKFVLTLQEGATHEEILRRTRFVAPIFKKIFFKADVIQVISRYLGDFARRMNPHSHIELIPNGVPILLFENPAPKPFAGNGVALITTSRLSRKNGLSDVIAALPLLPPQVRFEILGIGELEAELKALAERLGVSERVRFVGFVPYQDIPPYLHHADIFIRPSLSEGLGNSFIEAMAAGLPVVATPVGGIPDFLKDGETGVFCKPSDPQSVAAAVQRLIDDPALRERVKANALAMVRERYDWDLIAEEMRRKVFAT
jgi:glycosyltransferase involved in cell wall biosynthesis